MKYQVVTTNPKTASIVKRSEAVEYIDDAQKIANALTESYPMLQHEIRKVIT